MKTFYDSDFRIGILGGGQLGRMFIQEAVNFNLSVHIIDPDINAPCSQISHNFTQGDIKDFDTVYEFGKDKDVITIEIEHVNVEALKKLESEGVKVFPQPRVIEMVQDKGSQKEFYLKNNIPTAPFFITDNKEEIEQYLSEFPFMQKMRKGGYDGKGVQALKSTTDMEKAWDSPSVLEKFVDFKKELSVVVGRNEKGEIKSFPIVELEFNHEANLVEFLFAPANISQGIEAKAQLIAHDLIEKLDMVGILAVEMFLTQSDDILVNEIAPRAHNSGHQTIEANYTSQYEQHLRAILNLPLGSTKAIMPSVMLNLLGEKEHIGKVKYEGLEDIINIEGVYPHIYGKSETKPFRKMGHVTVLNKEIDKAIEIAKDIKNTLKART